MKQTKRSVNVENANAVNLLYHALSTTKLGVDSEKPWQKRSPCSSVFVLLLCCSILLQQVNQAIVEECIEFDIIKEAAVRVRSNLYLITLFAAHASREQKVL